MSIHTLKLGSIAKCILHTKTAPKSNTSPCHSNMAVVISSHNAVHYNPKTKNEMTNTEAQR